EAVVALLSDQLEARRLVDPASRREHVVRPQHQLAVAAVAREEDALVDEASAQAVPARPAFHEQYAQLRRLVILAHTHDTAGAPSVHLRDPRVLAAGPV